MKTLSIILGLLACSSPLSAATMTATLTGTVPLFYDTTGVFGVEGIVENSLFSLVYTYDTDRGRYDTSTPENPGLYNVDGEPAAVRASLTINGFTQRFMGSYFGTIQMCATTVAGCEGGFAGFEAFDYRDDAGSPEGYLSNIVSIFLPTFYVGSGFSFPGDLTTPFSTVLDPSFGDYRYGYFSISEIPANGSAAEPSREAAGQLKPTFLTVQAAAVSAVPIPASFGLLLGAIAVLSGVGAHKRRLLA